VLHNLVVAGPHRGRPPDAAPAIRAAVEAEHQPRRRGSPSPSRHRPGSHTSSAGSGTALEHLDGGGHDSARREDVRTRLGHYFRLLAAGCTRPLRRGPLAVADEGIRRAATANRQKLGTAELRDLARTASTAGRSGFPMRASRLEGPVRARRRAPLIVGVIDASRRPAPSAVSRFHLGDEAGGARVVAEMCRVIAGCHSTKRAPPRRMVSSRRNAHGPAKGDAGRGRIRMQRRRSGDSERAESVAPCFPHDIRAGRGGWARDRTGSRGTTSW